MKNREEKIERSCGAVVFTRDHGKICYVIVESKGGYFGFPKGHMEGSETERETALREIWEETGLRVALLDEFRTEDSHTLAREGHPEITKHIVYFLAQYSDQTPAAQESELNSVHLMEYDMAMQAFQFESSRRILREANCWLLENTEVEQ